MKAIDLFSGAGGFTTGATLAGANVVWAANHWPPAVECHLANHPGIEHVEQDLGEMDWTQCPEADLLLASPACQGFSQAGQPARKGTGGSHKPKIKKAAVKGQRDRNSAWAVLAAADTLRPERIIVENVLDMRIKWGATFDAWLGVLNSMGYATHVHSLNAIDYGGGQERQRLVVTAKLGARPVVLDQSTGAASPTIGDCLDPDDSGEHRWKLITKATDRMRPLIAKAQRGAGPRCFWANVSESRGRRMDEHFPTATTQCGSQWNLIDGDRIRVLNPREIARSMSFGDDYKLPSNRGLAGILIGNAIDVQFARGIVSQMLEA